MNPIIQIAGVIDKHEAALLCKAGVTHIGFPLRLLDGREDLAESEAKTVISSIGSSVTTVLITYLDDSDEVVDFSDYLGVGGIQLHGPISEANLEKIRMQRPRLFIIKSLIVRTNNLGELEKEVSRFHPFVDAFITDTYDPNTGRTGATGKTHDWAVSLCLVEFSPKPVVLAGGLTPENVRAAIIKVRPAGVDAHTSLEGPDGSKDPALVAKFVSEARQAFKLIRQ
jgi:phosphoribosylanthranilate isomerase